MATSAKTQVRIELRRFDDSDFDRPISWIPTAEALGEWCASFFMHPLTHAQLRRYLTSAKEPNVRAIFTAFAVSGEAVGHVEISHIWPHLSSRLSRVLVAPGRRRQGIGRAIAARSTYLDAMPGPNLLELAGDRVFGPDACAELES